MHLRLLKDQASRPLPRQTLQISELKTSFLLFLKYSKFKHSPLNASRLMLLLQSPGTGQEIN